MPPLKPPDARGSALLDRLGAHDAPHLLHDHRAPHPLQCLATPPEQPLLPSQPREPCPRLPPGLLRSEHHHGGLDAAWVLPPTAWPALPSLFDRLRGAGAASPSLRARSEQLRGLVLRDLGDLLNACNDEHRLDPLADAAALASCCNFGIGALAGRFADRSGWIRLELAIRQAVARFEPRIVAESVQLQPAGQPRPSAPGHVLHFAMSGLIRDLPRDLEFVVRSAVDLESRHWRLLPLAGAAGEA